MAIAWIFTVTLDSLQIELNIMIENLVYLYLLSPLHTGAASQEGNLLGIARESHTDLPYIPSSTIRGRLRASVSEDARSKLFGTDLKDSDKLEQGSIWIGDGSILWIPVPSLSDGVIWISSPTLLQRWKRLKGESEKVPKYSTNLKRGKNIYLKDAILKDEVLQEWSTWANFIPKSNESIEIDKVLVMPDQHCAILIQMSLWRQVKIKLDENKSVDSGFRYEEAIPPDTVMYFPWGITSQFKGSSLDDSGKQFKELLRANSTLQIGGQESLGRGFVHQWII
jgi:CRISPR-associated protein Cmr4